jgi:PAS domain S-box-containing protein
VSTRGARQAGEAPSAVAEAQELTGFFSLSADLLVVLDAELKVAHANPAWLRLGHAPERLVRRSVLDVVAPRERQHVRDGLLGVLAEGTRGTLETLVLTRTGGLCSTSWSVTVDPTGHRLFCAAHDVTETRRLERELAHAQRLEAVGQLAGGVAHEINTPIQYVGDNLTFLEDAYRQTSASLQLLQACAVEGQTLTPERLRVALGTASLEFLLVEVPAAFAAAQQGLERVAELVRSLKEFAHPDQGERAPADLNRALEQAVTVSRNEWKHVADLETRLSPLPQVLCRKASLNQVFLNLIVNAAHAIEDRQHLTGNHEKGRITVSSRVVGPWAELSVADTGTGIAEAARARVFDPFFTTKRVGRGTGQGLAIARSIVVDQHHGQLDFETEWGQGTTFLLRLPLDGRGGE